MPEAAQIGLPLGGPGAVVAGGGARLRLPSPGLGRRGAGRGRGRGRNLRGARRRAGQFVEVADDLPDLVVAQLARRDWGHLAVALAHHGEHVLGVVAEGDEAGGDVAAPPRPVTELAHPLVGLGTGVVLDRGRGRGGAQDAGRQARDQEPAQGAGPQPATCGSDCRPKNPTGRLRRSTARTPDVGNAARPRRSPLHQSCPAARRSVAQAASDPAPHRVPRPGGRRECRPSRSCPHGTRTPRPGRPRTSSAPRPSTAPSRSRGPRP